MRPFGAYTTAHAATAYSRSPKRWSEIHGAVASAVNARDLHAFLEVKKDFSDWIKKQLERARLLEGRDYIIFPQKGENSGLAIAVRSPLIFVVILLITLWWQLSGL